MTDPGTGGGDFAAVVAGDLAARREALDQLDELTFAADRAGMLILHADGRVEARGSGRRRGSYHACTRAQS